MALATAFFHGFLLALGLILPLGVQNVFVFSQGAYQASLVRALPAVIAASVSDTLLIVLSVQGVSVAVLKISWLKLLLVVVGVAFLGYMGWSTWRSKPGGDFESETAEWPVKRQVLFALSVSLLNPHAILDTIGVIGTSSLSYIGNDKLAFTVACVLVSWLWFILLATAGRMVRSLDGTGYMLGVMNRISAIIMWGSGLYLIYLFRAIG